MELKTSRGSSQYRQKFTLPNLIWKDDQDLLFDNPCLENVLITDAIEIESSVRQDVEIPVDRNVFASVLSKRYSRLSINNIILIMADWISVWAIQEPVSCLHFLSWSFSACLHWFFEFICCLFFQVCFVPYAIMFIFPLDTVCFKFWTFHLFFKFLISIFIRLSSSFVSFSSSFSSS